MFMNNTKFTGETKRSKTIKTYKIVHFEKRYFGGTKIAQTASVTKILDLFKAAFLWSRAPLCSTSILYCFIVWL